MIERSQARSCFSLLGLHHAVVVMFMSVPCRMIDPVFEEPVWARSIWLLGWGRWLHMSMVLLQWRCFTFSWMGRCMTQS